MRENLTTSVLIPVYANPKIEVGQLITDLALQTYKRFDINFIYEDKSFDYDFVSFVEQYSEINEIKNTIVCLPVENNLGIGFALNFGMSKIISDIVIRADVGDRIRNDRFAKVIKALCENDNDVVYSQANLISSNGSHLSSYPTNLQALNYSFALKNPICHPTVAFRRKIVAELGSYDANLNFCEDLDLWLRLRKAGVRFGCVNEPLVSYVVPEKTRNKLNWRANLIVRIKNFGSPNYISSLIGILLIATYCIIPTRLKEKVYHVIKK